MTAGPANGVRPVRRLRRFVALSLAGIAVLTALGVWQVERRAWKLDLINRVDRRIHAAPAPLPDRKDWPQINAAADAYRHVRVRGHYLYSRETLVQAVTELGRGFWVVTPLRTDNGTTVLVNRGFVPPDRRNPATRPVSDPAGEIAVTGLLRMTEPGGGFLHANNPAANRWYSRDVTAIAAARGLTDIAPFFIDADATAGRAVWPIGGLTVVSFPNNHLVYALTWFSLAAMLAAWTVYVVRDEWRLRKSDINPGAEAGGGPHVNGFELLSRHARS